DSATHGWYPGSDGKVTYGEGVLVGYRHFDAHQVEPAFCFGHGLSYTTFAYGEPTVVADGAGVSVVVEVTNTGARRGSEVVQLYVGEVEARVTRPVQELKAFAKIELDPGETAAVHLELDERAFAFWDGAIHGWAVEPGAFDLHLGSSSRAIHQSIRIER
ncbi:MAG TPA: fibronectin type III-like domain-contianing protein, partial [Acidimicrobiales bacterium]